MEEYSQFRLVTVPSLKKERFEDLLVYILLGRKVAFTTCAVEINSSGQL